MKRFALIVLREFSRTILSIYKPTVIAVTGSVGKTSTKQAIGALFEYDETIIRIAPQSYNTDWGVPLTIIGAPPPAGSFWGWVRVYARALKLVLWKHRSYPQLVLLEMGADRRGDIHRLVSLAQPTIGVLTAIAPAHLETFGSLQDIAQEKLELLRAVPKSGQAIVSWEVCRRWSIEGWVSAPVTTVGFSSEADVSASDIHYRTDSHFGIGRGTTFKLHWRGSAVPCILPDVVGEASVQSVCLASAVGLALGMNLLDISQRLRHIRGAAGRMRLVDGIRESVIIDDTYNASPTAMAQALEVLLVLGSNEGRTTWAVLGDMAELGTETQREHHAVGSIVAHTHPSYLVTVGPNARMIATQAIEEGYPVERVRRTTDAWEAGRMIQQDMREGDLVLVKGSQIMRTERVVKEIMAKPMDAAMLLVRQEWWWR